MEFIKWDKLGGFLTDACDEYEKSAPTVYDYLNNLYVRIEQMDKVYLREICFLERLKESDQWMQPNYAANQLYHLMHDLGMDTTGQAGF